MRDETTIFYWTDRVGRPYARLRVRGGRWRLEWGHRHPPGSDNEVQSGEHVTSAPDEAIRWMHDRVRELSGDPEEAQRMEQKLRAALGADASESEEESS